MTERLLWLLRMGCSYGAMLSGSLASFFSHFLFLCISIGLIATTLYNNISLFSSFSLVALSSMHLRDVDSRGTGIRGSNHSSLPIPFLRAFPQFTRLVTRANTTTATTLLSPTWVPPWGFRTRRTPSPPVVVPPHDSIRPSESRSAGAYVSIV